MAGEIVLSPHPDVTVPDVALHEFVLEGAMGRADQAALIDGPSGRTLTYGQLAGGVRRVAAGLAARGFAKGDVFAIFCPNLPEYALAFYGVSAAGGVNTTISPLYTTDELTRQLTAVGERREPLPRRPAADRRRRGPRHRPRLQRRVLVGGRLLRRRRRRLRAAAARRGAEARTRRHPGARSLMRRRPRGGESRGLRCVTREEGGRAGGMILADLGSPVIGRATDPWRTPVGV